MVDGFHLLTTLPTSLAEQSPLRAGIGVDSLLPQAHVEGSSQLLVVVVIIAVALATFLIRWFARRELAETQTALAECRRRESKLRESETWYRALFECSRDAVMILDEKGFLDCNQSTLRLFGCASRDEFIACHPSELSPTTQPDGRDSRAAADDRIRTALREGTCSFEWRHQRIDGTPFMAHVLLSRIDQRDRRVLLAVVRDISEQKRTEEALRIASRNATEANEAKTAFLSNVSHELRTPLHGILSFAAFGMRRTELIAETELHEYFDLIRQSGHTLLALVNDLLDLSKFETGQADLIPSQVDMNSLVLRVIDEWGSRATRDKVTIQLANGDTHVPVVCDEARMTQVMRNLIGNAVKFSKEGDIVQIAVVPGDRDLTVSVTDHGVGIPEGELERIFDKFYRSTKTRANHGGTGLGLAICREIVEAHGGRIWAENRPSGDTALVFQIPLSPTSPSAPDRSMPIPPVTMDLAPDHPATPATPG